jgi:hypothetical protein
MSRELSDRLAQSAPDASPELANVSFVPLALDFIFPDGVLPWAPVPDPGTTPTVTPINGTVDVRQNLEIYSYETVFANNLNASLYSSFDMVLLENRGTIWSQDADGSVMLASGGNWEAIVNDGQMIAISGSGSATGFSSGSWGILKTTVICSPLALKATRPVMFPGVREPGAAIEIRSIRGPSKLGRAWTGR